MVHMFWSTKSYAYILTDSQATQVVKINYSCLLNNSFIQVLKGVKIVAS